MVPKQVNGKFICLLPFTGIDNSSIIFKTSSRGNTHCAGVITVLAYTLMSYLYKRNLQLNNLNSSMINKNNSMRRLSTQAIQFLVHSSKLNHNSDRYKDTGITQTPSVKLSMLSWHRALNFKSSCSEPVILVPGFPYDEYSLIWLPVIGSFQA